MNEQRSGFQPRVSARLRLTLSYAVYLVAAGAVTLFGVYVLMLYVPTYPLTTQHREDAVVFVSVGNFSSRQEVVDAVLLTSGIILLALLVMGIIGGWLLTGWVLRPLRTINDATRIAAAGRLDHRIHLAGRNDEFRQLADSFDGMLDRLEDAFSAQERFAANASHELRTPLAVTATMLDVARRNPDGQDYHTLIERLGATNARAIMLTEALLRLADANSITATSELVNFDDIVRIAVAEHEEEAEPHGVQIDIRLGNAWTVGDPTLLAQLAANLIQNAIRHNIEGGRVDVATVQDRRHLTVSFRVENTGATYTPDIVAQLSEPLVRGSGRTSQGAGVPRGYGLGLALVSRITEVHHGDLTIVPRRGGGLVVGITLPYANPGLQTRAPGRLDDPHVPKEPKPSPSTPSGAAVSRRTA